MTRPPKVSPSSQEHISLSNPSEELKGLLSGFEAEELKQSSLCHLLSFGLARIAAAVTGLLCLVFGLVCWFSAPPSSITPLHFNGDTLRSNGTHDFKRTVLLVSIDGLRDALFDVRSPPIRSSYHPQGRLFRQGFNTPLTRHKQARSKGKVYEASIPREFPRPLWGDITDCIRQTLTFP